jgi:hypothetical protein
MPVVNTLKHVPFIKIHSMAIEPALGERKDCNLFKINLDYVNRLLYNIGKSLWGDSNGKNGNDKRQN